MGENGAGVEAEVEVGGHRDDQGKGSVDPAIAAFGGVRDAGLGGLVGEGDSWAHPGTCRALQAVLHRATRLCPDEEEAKEKRMA